MYVIIIIQYNRLGIQSMGFILVPLIYYSFFIFIFLEEKP